jgi:Uma2 family endonuclease
MNVIVRQPRTVEEFLRWDGDGDAKYEFVDGRPVMLPTPSLEHSRIVFNIAGVLSRSLDRSAWRVHLGDLGLRIEGHLRVPDVMVGRSGPRGRANATDDAVLVIEILSPDSIATDMREKPREYLSLPSLREYLVLAQDEVRGWLWSRSDEGAWPVEPKAIKGGEAVVPVRGIGIELPFSEVYFGTLALEG